MQISGNFFGESHTGPFAKIALTFQPCDTYVLFYISLHRRVTSNQETGQWNRYPLHIQCFLSPCKNYANYSFPFKLRLSNLLSGLRYYLRRYIVYA